MGNRHSIFTEKQFQELEDCTFFTRGEIIKIYKLFGELTAQSQVKGRLVKEEFMELGILFHNPFKERMFKVFCSDPKQESLSFEDFLDFLSVFSPQASKDIKSYTAFKIYDFDDDGVLGPEDIKHVIRRITTKNLTDNETSHIVTKVLAEADIDDDGFLSFVEFDQIIARSSDFMNLFRINVL